MKPDIINYPDELLLLLWKKPELFKSLPIEYQNNIDFIANLQAYNVKISPYLPDHLRNHKQLNLVDDDLNNNPFFASWAKKALQNKSVLVQTLAHMNLFTTSSFWPHIPKKYANDVDIMKKAIKKNSFLLSHNSSFIKNNEEIAFMIALHHKNFFGSLGSSIRGNLEFAKKCFIKKPVLVDLFTVSVKTIILNNKELVSNALSSTSNGWLYRKISPELKNDPDIISLVLKKHYSILYDFPSQLQDDPIIVAQALLKSRNAIEYASSRLKKEFAKIKEECRFDNYKQVGLFVLTQNQKGQLADHIKDNPNQNGKVLKL